MGEIFHLLRTGSNQYLTMKVPQSDTMYLSFKNLKTATKCKKYIEHHKKKYGMWPSLNMDKDYATLEMDRMSISEPLYIDNITLPDVESIMQRSGMGFMYCHDFGMIPLDNSFTLNFRAQELATELDLAIYLKCLEDIIDL